MDKILITGATGTVGSAVVSQLHKLAYDFRVLVRSQKKAQPFTKKKIDTALGRYEDRQSIGKAFEDIAGVFLVAPASRKQLDQEINLVEAAKKAGVTHIVKLSAMGASKDSHIHLARWHAESEEYIRQSGLSFTFLRPHYFMQNLLSYKSTIQSDAAIYAPMGDGSFAMVDARDIASVAVEALTSSGHKGNTYIITGPEAVSMYEVADVFGKVLEQDIRYYPISPEQAEQTLLDMGLEDWYASDLAELGRIYASGQAASVSDVVQKITGRKAISIQTFVQDYAESFKQ